MTLHLGTMKKLIKEYWQLVVAIVIVTFICCLMFSGCASTKEVEHVYHHDTVYSNSVVHDSVDRWHTHYEYLRGDTLHVIDTFWRDRWHIAHDTAYKTVVDVQTRDVEKVVEKKVYILWPLWVALGIVAVIVGGCFWLNHELNKMAKEED